MIIRSGEGCNVSKGDSLRLDSYFNLIRTTLISKESHTMIDYSTIINVSFRPAIKVFKNIKG